MLGKNTVKNLFVSCALMLTGVATCSKPVLANSLGVYYTECSNNLKKCLSDLLMDCEQVSPHYKCVSISAVRKCLAQEEDCVDEKESKRKCSRKYFDIDFDYVAHVKKNYKPTNKR